MLQRITTVFIASAIAGCAVPASTVTGSDAARSITPEDARPSACVASGIAEAPSDRVGYAYGPGLATESLRLVTWNAHKNAGNGLHEDLDRLAAQADLVLLQEAVVDGFHMERMDPAFHWVFAPGYVQRGTTTGVMTASRMQPEWFCRLSRNEPWLGSPKATSITRYRIEGRSESLLVVNVHLINFTLGLDAVSRQLGDAMALIESHAGPVIVSGDFNTWSPERDRYVRATLATAGLSAVRFDEDQRTRFFGHAVDHVFVRGLRVATATTHPVSSSDHNPLEVLLEII